MSRADSLCKTFFDLEHSRTWSHEGVQMAVRVMDLLRYNERKYFFCEPNDETYEEDALWVEGAPVSAPALVVARQVIGHLL
jgi:hypothetical protein